MAVTAQITSSLRQLHLPTFVDNYSRQADLATNEDWSYDRYLHGLCKLELEERRLHGYPPFGKLRWAC